SFFDVFRAEKSFRLEEKASETTNRNFSDVFQAEKDFRLEEKASEMTNRNFSNVFHGMMGIVKSGGPT
ncbi:MAG: hypothetical protein K6E48_02215, partial [Lachnospiraceae bacterium]|nr:hypothetical protein [Lachnospiraceae bacterium]